MDLWYSRTMTTMGNVRLEPKKWLNFTRLGGNLAGRAFNLLIAVLAVNWWAPHLAAAPAHPHPYLMPPAEKQRLLERLRSSETARQQIEAIKARANQGKFADAALVFALEGGQESADTVRRHLLELVHYRSPRLDEDIAAGGHREGNMDFYWDTADVRAYDLVYPALSPEDRDTIETFYRKLGRYWRDSLSRWTTTPNLVFPIHQASQHGRHLPGQSAVGPRQLPIRDCRFDRAGLLRKPRPQVLLVSFALGRT